MIGTATVLQADARNLPIADSSVDLICTSPPYFALRSYQDGGQHYGGQIGSEDTPQAWLENLWACTAEMVRVLKPEGSIFVNLGDKYAGNHGTDRTRFDPKVITGAAWRTKLPTPSVTDGGRPKSLLGLPWRYAIGCIDRLGLILRAEIIWNKPNGLPESVTDRVRRSHEQWFHMVKQPRYFSAVDEIREPQLSLGRKQGGSKGRAHVETLGEGRRLRTDTHLMLDPLGKLPGSVWEIPTEPLQVPPHLGVDHFAAYPTEWPRRIITGWTPNGICQECGQGRRPTTEFDYVRRQQNFPGRTERNRDNNRSDVALPFGSSALRLNTITGYACGCPTPNAPTHPSVILDPFGGTGTTALVAKALGRHGITVDLSADYTRLARWRTNNPDQLAKAAQVAKPPPVIDGQLSLDGVW